jgi:glycerol kinase
VDGVILAVDQGSSSSRAVVFDSALTPVAAASRPIASAFPAPGRVEHDAGEITDGVLSAIGEALARAGAGWPDVAGIGLAAQTETFVVWDTGTGRPVFPAISWRDTRASDACAELRAAGHEAGVRSRTGLPLEPAFSASKLRWLLDELPGARRAAAGGKLLFGDVGCWLTWQLTGGAVHVTDPSMASRTMLFNLAAGSWDAAMLDLFDVPAAMLPAIAPTAGRFAVTGAAACGGRATIGAIAGDQQAALFGQRCWQPGMTKLTLGTGAFLWCNAGTAPPVSAPAGVVSTCAWQVGDVVTYALEGFVPNAGAVTTWLRQLGVLGAGEWPLIRDDALSGRAAGQPGQPSGEPGRAGGPWCVPALFGLGTPSWTPLAVAEIGGLTADSTGEDIAEAAMLGVVHQIVDAVDAVRAGLANPPAVLGVDGGLARNDSVLQAIADLSGLRLERTAAAEVTALGAGALAGLGTGQWDEAALAALPFETDRNVLPGLAQSEAGTARTAWQRVLAGVLGGVPGGRPGDVPGGRPEHPGAGPDRPGQAGGAP